MRAIQYHFSLLRYLAIQAMNSRAPQLLVRYGIPGLACDDIKPAPLPGSDWVRLHPIYSGICGSDMTLLTAKGSPALSPFLSFPIVLGHEIVAQVSEVGKDVSHLAPGDHVLVDPFISCTMRGLDPCPNCCRGEPCLCTNVAEGSLAPGMLTGFCRDLPGGWSEEMIAHFSQLYPIPSEIPLRTAVLVEPLSVGIHAVLKLPPALQSRILITGGGTVGLCMLAALRLLGIRSHITMLVRYPFQAKMAEKFGADVVEYDWHGQGAGKAAMRETGAREYKPLIGKPVYTGGFDWVYDCAGTAQSFDQSMRVANMHGHVFLVGCTGEVKHLDLSFIWAHELDVQGSYGYARERSIDGEPHTFQVAFQLLTEQPTYPLADLITHEFPLTEWRQAIRTNLERRRSHTIKTIFVCQGADG